MQELVFQNIAPDFINDPIFNEKNIKVSVLRLDKIHPVISGNKWFKLQYYLQEAQQLQKKTIVTFGGAWSNHIVATAAACKMNGFHSIGIIRGEKAKDLSPTLLTAKEFGMKLYFISREEYKAKKIPPELIHPESYFIPEGGYGEKGVKGAATILNYCNKDDFTHFCCAVGTGTMMAGLISASSQGQQVVGISVLKNNLELERNIKVLIPEKNNFQLIHDYHFGGYAKYSNELLRFINDFYELSYIPTDIVYTSKLFFGVYELIRKNYFPAKSKLLLIHSGGLQGNNSLTKGTLIF